MHFDLKQHTILLTLAGSRAYGTHTEASDVDIKGVCIPPKPCYLGLSRFEQADSPNEMNTFMGTLNPDLQAVVMGSKLEGTVYELKKFVELALDANPNILDVLFCRDADVLMASTLGEELRAMGHLFISAKAKHTFSGYAMAQLKRIRHHRSWLLNPPQKKPTRADFGLPEQTLVPADHLAAISAAVQKQTDLWEPNLASLSMSDRVAVQGHISTFLEEFCAQLPEGLVAEDDRIAGATWLAAARHVGVDDSLVYVLQKEREYAAAMRHWSQYQSWVKSRNSDRAALEARHGFDTKHGMHLVRLLRMGREILTTGQVHVWRGPGGAGDADELRAIRDGAWDYDHMVEWAEKEDSELNRIYKENSYTLRKSPNRALVEQCVIRIIEKGLI